MTSFMIGGYGGASQENTGGAQASGRKQPQGPGRKEALMPVTCKILRTQERLNEEQGTLSSDGSLRIFGEEDCQVMLVGAIDQPPEVGENRIGFTLNDTTQRLRVQHFFTEDDPEASMLRGLKKGQYVRVVGKARAGKESLNVSSQICRPIENPDEISYHLIESCHTALKCQKEKAPAGLQVPAGVMEEAAQQTPTKGAAPPRAPVAAADIPTPMNAAVAQKGATLEDFLKAFLKTKGEEGCKIADVNAHCKGRFEEAVVKKWLDVALENGDIFNTVDDDTVALTDMS